jgi:molybdenum cofactor biosynthesis protein B
MGQNTCYQVRTPDYQGIPHLISIGNKGGGSHNHDGLREIKPLTVFILRQYRRKEILPAQEMNHEFFNPAALQIVAMNPDHIQSLKIVGAVITVSSTRTPDTDTSGETIIRLLKEAGIEIFHYAIVPDTLEAIRHEVITALKGANCIVLNGGTGLTHDDCTIEAVLPLMDKRIEGFGELFRMISYQEIGSSAMLSRALAGISGGKAIFCIPGSTGAVKLATSGLIIPEIGHILTHASK